MAKLLHQDQEDEHQTGLQSEGQELHLVLQLCPLPGCCLMAQHLQSNSNVELVFFLNVRIGGIVLIHAFNALGFNS